MRYQQIVLFFFVLLTSWVQAQVVHDIKVEGINVLNRSVIIKQLDIKVKDDVTEADLNLAMKHMYHSGLYDRVELSIEQGVLKVQVAENPVIRKVVIHDAKELKDDQKESLKDEYSIKKGKILNPQKLKELIFEIESTYELLGFSDAYVEYEIKPYGKAAADVILTVHQGDELKVKSIKYSGNTQFSGFTLNRMIGFRQTHFLSVIMKDDLFSKSQLENGVHLIKDAYIDKGFMDVSVKKHVKYNKKKHQVEVKIDIDEGKVYKVSKVNISGLKVAKKHFGQLHQEKVKKKLEGKIFNRTELIKIKEYLAEYYEDQGYSSVEVGIRTSLNHVNKTMAVDYVVRKGSLTKVRFIHFNGNLNTEDYVLRRAMRQQESKTYSSYSVRESHRRLMNLPYISHAEIKKVPVNKDTVDLHVIVKEEKTSMIKGEVGYIEMQGVSGSVSYQDGNILGTGQSMNLSASLSKSGHEIKLGLHQPYFLGSDISQDILVSSKKTNFGKMNRNNYTIDGIKVAWGLTKSLTDDFYIGGRLQYNNDKLFPKDTSLLEKYIADFMNQYGTEFNTFGANMNMGYSHLDQVIQPSLGLRSGIDVYRTLSTGNSSLTYYKLDWNTTHFSRWFQNLVDDYWILRLHSALGYGRSFSKIKGDLPFYHRYHTGGMGSLRGYDSSSLGKRSASGISQGGNVYYNFNADLIFSVFDQKFLVPSVFFDAGAISLKSLKSSDFRYSAGLSAQVVTPVGPVAFALSHPFNIKEGERRKRFSMTVGKIFN